MNFTKNQPMQQNKLRNLFLEVSRDMMTFPDAEVFFEKTLINIGKLLEAKHVFMAECNAESWFFTHTWSVPQAHSLSSLVQGVDFSDFASLDDVGFTPNNVKIFNIFDEGCNAFDKCLLEAMNLVCFMAIPFFEDGTCTGFWGIDCCQVKQEYFEQCLKDIETLSYLLQGVRRHFQTRRIAIEHEKSVQKILDIFPVPVYIIGASTFEFLLYNKAFNDFIGDERLLKTKCYQVLHNFTEPCSFCNLGKNLEVGVPIVWSQHNNKYSKDVTIIESRILWGNVEKAHAVVLIDISDSLALQKEQVLEREIFQAKARFLASMSHELRTPVNGIEGMVNLAEKKNTNPVVANYLSKIYFSARSLLNVINNILDYSKIEADKMELEVVPFQVHDAFEKVANVFTQEALDKKLQNSFQIAENVPKIILGDSLRIMQIVQNLINNALKFTEKGSVTVQCNWQYTNDSSNITDGKLIIIVSDTGIGIAQEKMKLLFDLFYLGDESFSRKYGGTGIGLPVTQGLVRLMNGQISVESEVGKGTTFTCHLPLTVVEKDCNSFKHVSTSEYCQDISATRIVLAEDNEINVIIAQEVLNDFGCTVDVASNGFEVLELLSKKTYDIVLMDMEMPHMNGFEATKKIRLDPKHTKLPIIAMSAHSIQDMKKMFLNEGINDYISKPFDSEFLRSVIYKHVRNN